jgi:hypothetical protein
LNVGHKDGYLINTRQFPASVAWLMSVIGGSAESLFQVKNVEIRKSNFIRDKILLTSLSIFIAMRAGFLTQRGVFYKIAHIQTLLDHES